jgi:hypothetical protein
MKPYVRRLRGFADQAHDDGYEHVVLLGMGGSSLAPEVFKRTYGSAPGYPSLTVLDTTVPATILATERAVDLHKTLFVVASKSGSTVETLSHLAYFWERTGQRGEQFVAITDPGTSLESLARERGFRECFLNPPDIGGRYSALSLFGLVPAALLGMDLNAMIQQALNHRALCSTFDGKTVNVGLRLGTFLGAAATSGRDKLTLITPESVSSFGLWVEQLIAESTGKNGTGIVPVVGESLGAVEVYGIDRVFVSLDSDDASSGDLDAIIRAGHPLARFRLESSYDLIGQCFSWEFATAVAGSVLRINPFDEPNVQEAKDQTKAALAAFEQSRDLPGVPTSSIEEVGRFIGASRAGDYLSIQAYLPYDEAIEASLQDLRGAVRDAYKIATAVGYGPRFLHSTGQLHKGGPNTGIFVQVVGEIETDVPIPGSPYSFGVLNAAQAVGDFRALEAHGRRVVRLDVGRDPIGALTQLAQLIGRRG